MTPPEFRDALRQTLGDLKLSRSERRALGAVLGDPPADPALLAQYRGLAFDVARDAAAAGAPPTDVLGWLEDVVKLLHASGGGPSARAEASFSPGDDCLRQICGLFRLARRSADVCVFTITDNRIADALLDAHRRGVIVRIVTDNEKSFDAGSDIQSLAAAGVPVRIDVSEFHMHHKFALFDGQTVLTGSYNWTRSAAEVNEENLVVLDDPRLVRQFQTVFDGLWERFA